MRWLHMLFALFFVLANGHAKSAQQLRTTVLLFLPLYFSCRKTNIEVSSDELYIPFKKFTFPHLKIPQHIWFILKTRTNP